MLQAQTNYYVTVQKPTIVSHVAVGAFTGPTDVNLIVARSTLLEVYMFSPSGLVAAFELRLHGKIGLMQLFRPPGASQDSLLIVTDKFKMCVLAVNSANGELVTRTFGDLRDATGKASEAMFGAVDPQCHLAAVRLVDGILKILPIENGQMQDAFNVRLEEVDVLDMVFLHGTLQPTLCVLFVDANKHVHVKTYHVNLRRKELDAGPWSYDVADADSSMLIALPDPLGGVLIVGEQHIVYKSRTSVRQTPLLSRNSIIKAHAKIDDNGSRYLLGDHLGALMLLVIHTSDSMVTGLSLEPLGTTVVASCLTYLDNGFVYVGSASGDSQMIRLTSEQQADSGFFFELMDTQPNDGPIVDFCVVELDRQSQCQLVTCSGAGKDGSIRVIRNGIGISELASVPMEGVRAVWSLGDASSGLDRFVVMSFVTEIRLLAVHQDEATGEAVFREAHVPGLSMAGSTLVCGTNAAGQYVQVTELEVRLVDPLSLALLACWKPPGGDAKISAATLARNYAALALGGGTLVLLAFGAAGSEGSMLVQISTRQFPHEIACLDCAQLGSVSDSAVSAPMDTDQPAGSAAQHERELCAVGFWGDVSVHLLAMPSLDTIHVESLAGEVIPRSVMLCVLDGASFLLCGLGDGALVCFCLAGDGSLSARRKVSLGVQPVSLTRFESSAGPCVFACADRPTILFGSNGKLAMSTASVANVTAMAPFRTAALGNALALATSSELMFGTIDAVQKLHKRVIPLAEQPLRICHHEPSRTYAVLTQHTDMQSTSVFVRLFDGDSFTLLSSFKLAANELGMSMLVAPQAGSPGTVLIYVGTAFMYEDQPETTSGRIIAFEVVDRTLRHVAELRSAGCVYSLQAMGAYVLACVNSMIELIEWTPAGDGLAAQREPRTMRHRAAFQNFIVALEARVSGNKVIVGDLMRSVSLISYSEETNKFTELARDPQGLWLMDLGFLDDGAYLAADNFFNLVTLRQNAEATDELEARRLERVGKFHLGEPINRIMPGSLVMQTDSPLPRTLILATATGCIGVLASLDAERFAFASHLQSAMRAAVPGVGGLPHEDWRTFEDDTCVRMPSERFVDGDLVGLFFDLPGPKKAAIAVQMDSTVAAIERQLDEITRMLH